MTHKTDLAQNRFFRKMMGRCFFLFAVAVFLFVPVFPSLGAEKSLDEKLDDAFFSVTKYKSGEAKMKNLEVEDMNRNQAFLAQDKDKISVILVWAPWCGACLTELPTIREFQKNNSDVTVIYVGDDKNGFESVRDTLEKDGISFKTSYYDSRGYIRKWQRVKIYPTTFIVSPEGDILYRFEGDTDWSKPLMFEFIESLKKQEK